MQRLITGFVVFSLLMSQVSCPALACMMTPKDYKGRISQNRHQAILFHQGDRQELILRVNYKIAGDKMPDQFAWIITTPTEPAAYHLAPE